VAVKIYNTLSRSREEFKPGDPPEVSFYVCGPTVYDYIHIGNARVFVVFDVIRRYLNYRGYRVKYIQNYTDIDDKMINRANEQGVSVNELADRFIKAYEEDVAALRVRPADVKPKATEHIPQIIELVEKLLANGYAYISDGDVYYDTSSYPQYGQLAHQNQDDLLAGARVEPGEKKKSPLDFVLWKQKKEGEPAWQSPWGEGRPGWHIECSAMSGHYLDDILDIHAGGADLIFPHHENEIAQTWGAEQKPLARYWLHAGYLNIEEQKMSKSLGNVLTVRNLLEEHDPLDLRFLLLSAHYRSPLNFSAELVAQSRSGRMRLQEAVTNLLDATKVAVDASGDKEEKLRADLGEAKERFVEAMDDDFNTADALGVIFDLVRSLNKYIKEAPPYNRLLLEEVLQFFREINEIFELIDLASPEALDDELEDMIKRREKARAEKDFATADQIRDDLLARGIVLEDTPHGTRWKRK